MIWDISVAGFMNKIMYVTVWRNVVSTRWHS